MNNRIKKLRREMELTQEKFGARIGVKGNTVAQWESGRNDPPDSAITFICKEFGVNEEWLRSGTGEMFKPSPSSALDALAAEYGLDHGSYIAIEKFLKLSPELREGMISYFKEVTAALADVDPETPAMPTDTTAAEAAYEKSLGIAPSGESTVLNIIDDTENVG